MLLQSGHEKPCRFFLKKIVDKKYPLHYTRKEVQGALVNRLEGCFYSAASSSSFSASSSASASASASGSDLPFSAGASSSFSTSGSSSFFSSGLAFSMTAFVFLGFAGAFTGFALAALVSGSGFADNRCDLLFGSSSTSLLLLFLFGMVSLVCLLVEQTKKTTGRQQLSYTVRQT